MSYIIVFFFNFILFFKLKLKTGWHSIEEKPGGRLLTLNADHQAFGLQSHTLNFIIECDCQRADLKIPEHLSLPSLNGNL